MSNDDDPMDTKDMKGPTDGGEEEVEDHGMEPDGPEPYQFPELGDVEDSELKQYYTQVAERAEADPGQFYLVEFPAGGEAIGGGESSLAFIEGHGRVEGDEGGGIHQIRRDRGVVAFEFALARLRGRAGAPNAAELIELERIRHALERAQQMSRATTLLHFFLQLYFVMFGYARGAGIAVVFLGILGSRIRRLGKYLLWPYALYCVIEIVLEVLALDSGMRDLRYAGYGKGRSRSLSNLGVVAVILRVLCVVVAGVAASRLATILTGCNAAQMEAQQRLAEIRLRRQQQSLRDAVVLARAREEERQRIRADNFTAHTPPSPPPPPHHSLLFDVSHPGMSSNSQRAAALDPLHERRRRRRWERRWRARQGIGGWEGPVDETRPPGSSDPRAALSPLGADLAARRHEQWLRQQQPELMDPPSPDSESSYVSRDSSTSPRSISTSPARLARGRQARVAPDVPDTITSTIAHENE